MLIPYLQLLLGVFACSVSVILIKASNTHPFVLAALRLALAGILLAPLYWRERSRHASVAHAATVPQTWFPALLLAVHFISWAYGARLAAAAQATLIVNLVPVAMPFFLYALARERITRMELAGTGVALAGLLVLSARDALTADANAWGNVVCFVSMLLFAGYLALGRRNRGTASVWLYVIPLYQRAALIALVFALPWLPTFAYTDGREWALMFGLACIPTLIGHSLLNASMRHLRGQAVSLANVAQFIFAGLLAWVFYRELPSGTFYIASVLAISGIVLVVLDSPAPRAVPPPD